MMLYKARSRANLLLHAGDKLLANKSHRELLAPYEQRAASAEAYLKAVRPSLTLQTGALLDPKVGACLGRHAPAAGYLLCFRTACLASDLFAAHACTSCSCHAKHKEAACVRAGADGCSHRRGHAGAGGVPGDCPWRTGHQQVQAGTLPASAAKPAIRAILSCTNL
jgi:hypothetical protein